MTTPYRKDALARDRIQACATALGIHLSDQEQWDFLESADSLDMQAAPGSGKTSLISLKLLILATHWTSTTRGICVLSHTNTAKDEIIARIGDTPAGARLQRYPHFIGTIQSFTSTFLARPYLRGVHKQLQIVDDDAYANRATRALEHDPRFRTLKVSLSRRSNGDDLVARATFAFESGQLTIRSSGKLPFGPGTTSSTQFTELKHHLANQGIFRFADMFALAELHLARRPGLGSAVAQRFPFVLVDEMQDTSDLQQNLLAQVFDHPATTVQRVGDINQRIFTEGAAQASSFPRPGFLELPVSRRFGREIAELASLLTVHRSQRIRGAGPTGTIAVLLYDENSVTKVVPAFERIAVEVVPPLLLQARPPQVLAARKRPGTARAFPQSLACYVPAFAASVLDDGRASLLLTARAARAQWRSGANRAAVDLLWEAVRVVFAAVTNESLPTLRSLDRVAGSPGARMRTLLLEILTEPIDDEVRWVSLMGRMTNVLSDLSGGTGRVRITLGEPSFYVVPPPGNSAAVCEHTGTASVTMHSEFNSIQRAKGETHSATLILECLDRTGKKYDVHEVLNLLAVDGDLDSASSTVRSIAQLVFVGATRPAQLLAFAVHRDRASSYLDLFESNGWAVHDLTLKVT
ncbi:UvrD-helicase domain-containing protein [Rhodococcus pyridinivorans]|uniref:UvrD-helicase domain-containing protein n=1 Tax=Rhodococcus pyridinivorans TaxID=103816 RepID=UPI0004049E1E|nr:UvrD-helicase domain-containing protein [Rhodococcus pyridinivorans]WAL49219.1 UvrD-helicase domain-containing protein [Rhodococcus pyridinivorans]